MEREGVFVASKSGYIPDDAESGVGKQMLVEQMVGRGEIQKGDVAVGIHCMHPRFLEQ